MRMNGKKSSSCRRNTSDNEGRVIRHLSYVSNSERFTENVLWVVGGDINMNVCLMIQSKQY